MQAAGSASGDKVYVEDVFSTHLYTGTGSGIAINNGIDLSGEGGLVIYRRRDGAENWSYQDTERGVDSVIYSDSSNAAADPGGYGLASFNSNGFTTELNTSSAEYCSWTFRKQAGFFDVVKFTAGTNTDRQISHSLSCVPGMIIVKDLDAGYMNWQIYHKSLGQSKIIYLNLTQAASTGNPWWGTTTHSSSNFSINESYLVNGNEHIAYLFADGDSSDAQIFGDDGDEAIIKTGSFSYSGSEVDINLGFEPQFFLYKASNVSNDWEILDVMRAWNETQYCRLNPHESAAEACYSNSSSNYVKPYANGVKFKTGGSGRDYIYIAIRRGPMKEPSAGTDVFKAISRTGGGGSASITGVGFSPDLYLSKATNQGSYNPVLYNRLRGKRYLLTSSNDAQAGSDGGLDSYDMDGVSVSGSSAYGLDGSGDSIINYFLKRYPKVFDVVVYSGTGSNLDVTHNLNAVPEIQIIKRLDSSSDADWVVYHKDVPFSGSFNGEYLFLADGTAGVFGSTTIFRATPTASVFKVGTNNVVNNSSGSYLWLGFASLSGISHVGSYTGTGNDINLTDLGAAARFVLIKRADDGVGGAGDWYVYDSTSGIVSGNDPYFFINSTAVSVTNTDYIDPHSSGFTITSSAPAALNASGGKYIYLAFS